MILKIGDAIAFLVVTCCLVAFIKRWLFTVNEIPTANNTFLSFTNLYQPVANDCLTVANDCFTAANVYFTVANACFAVANENLRASNGFLIDANRNYYSANGI